MHTSLYLFTMIPRLTIDCASWSWQTPLSAFSWVLDLERDLVSHHDTHYCGVGHANVRRWRCTVIVFRDLSDVGPIARQECETAGLGVLCLFSSSLNPSSPFRPVSLAPYLLLYLLIRRLVVTHAPLLIIGCIRCIHQRLA